MFKWTEKYLKHWSRVASNTQLVLNTVMDILKTVRSKGLEVVVDTNDNPMLESLGLDKIKVRIKLGQ